MPPTGWPSSSSIKRLTASEFTRPANTTQYTAGDSVGATAGTVHSFANAALSARTGTIHMVRLSKSDAGVTTATFRVWFYNASVTAINDNAAWTTLYADREKVVGYADLTMVSAGGSSAYAQVDANLEFELPTAANRTLYAVIQATGAYTPASAETFSLSITVERK
jgi:hypothetical protein